MDRLYFACPTTGRKVDVGIESELDTVLRIKSEHVTSACPHCGQRHEWLVRDAYLSKAGLSKAA
ncbi:MAG: hypothetical protein IT514_15615 [Burkholderiales bacterium]|nr:hypothetical protein [Burkholderiales bacterium]